MRTIHLTGKTIFLTKRKHTGNGLSKRTKKVMSGGDVLLNKLTPLMSGASKSKTRNHLVVSKGGAIHHSKKEEKPLYKLGKLHSKPIKLML
jgi:hypothetical protein